MVDNPEQFRWAAIERAKRKVELCAQLVAIAEARQRAGKVTADKVIEAKLALLEAETQLATVREGTKAPDRAVVNESATRSNARRGERKEQSHQKGTKPEKFKDRNDEIERLANEELPGGKHRTHGEIFNLIKSRWPLMENGKPLNAKAVAAALRRRRDAGSGTD